jgi:hypothetical protein
MLADMDRKEIPADPPEREPEQPAPEPNRAPTPPDEPEDQRKPTV